MDGKSYLVTGGAGFLGSVLVHRLVRAGERVRVFDNLSRGLAARLDDIADDIEFVEADIRDSGAVEKAAKGVESVVHLAFVNGTEFFYSKPELVLEVGVKGIINVIDACMRHGIGELVVASSSEVYQTPRVFPTDETVPLTIPDPLNPRYSYAAGKITSEMVALNYGRKHIGRVLIFRPHNVYGPDMGWDHVVPQLILGMRKLKDVPRDPVQFPIQGTGEETRSFVYIDDFIDGVMLMMEKGAHMGIYNIGTTEEMKIKEVARLVGEYFGRRVEIVPGERRSGGTLRRCPDIAKLAALGYRPACAFRDGLPIAAAWYDKNAHKAPARSAL